MASLINRACRKTIQQISLKNGPCYIIQRGTAIPAKKKPKVGTIKHRNLIDSSVESLAARGFLRSQKPYDPPGNVVEKIKNLISSSLGTVTATKILDRNEKFQLLNACFEELGHSVPNSMLHKINTPVDVLEFYSTAVSTTTPLDELKSKELPPNLHVQYNYTRFDANTDTMFNGISAYPESSTIVTGLKFKNKYKGHKERPPAYYDTWADYIKHTSYKPGSK